MQQIEDSKSLIIDAMEQLKKVRPSLDPPGSLPG